MIEAIKTLDKKQRLLGLLIIVLLSSVVSISTAYMKTDDCSALSEQYKTLVSSQAELMTINNNLIIQYNQARKDFMEVEGYLEKMAEIKPVTKETSKVDRNLELQTVSIQDPDDTVLVSAMVRPKEQVIEKTKIIKIQEIPSEMKNLLTKVKGVTNKYHE
jgi:hypothetical protein